MKRFAAVILSLVATAWMVPAARAAWNPPTCNPDAAGGPTAPACNVSAPLNVSAADQTKSGALTVENAVSAESVTVAPGSNGQGTIGITSNVRNDSAVNLSADQLDNVAGFDIAVNGTSATGITLDAAGLGATGLSITSAGVGLSVGGQTSGIGVTADTGRAGTFLSSGDQTSGAVLITNNTANGTGLDVVGGGAVDPASLTLPSVGPLNLGIGIRATAAVSYGIVGSTTSSNSAAAGILGLGTTGFGITGQSSGNYGVYGNSTDSSTFYGGAFCNNSSRCAFLGGPVYSASLSRTSIVDSLDSASSLTVDNNGAGYGITGTAEGGVGVFGGSSVGTGGYGVFGDGDTGVLAWGEVTTAIEAFGRNDADGIQVTTVGAGDGITVNTTGSGQGIGITTANATGLAVTSSSGPGVTISSTDVGISVASTDGVGVDIISTNNTALTVESSNSTGINITVPADQIALNTSGGVINHPGAFYGGQFYAADSYSIYDSVQKAEETIDLTFADPESIVFDGTDIWIGSAAGYIQRISVNSGSIIGEYYLGNGEQAAVLVFDYDEIHTYGAGILSRTINRFESHTAGTGIGPPVTEYSYGILSGTRAIAEDWLGAAGAIYVGSTTPSITGIGDINDIIYANQEIWAVDTTNDSLLRIDVNAKTIASTISVGDAPTGLVFDGINIWTANSGDNTLSKVNISTEEVESVDISSGGSTPEAILFDGVNLWISMHDSNRLIAYNIASGQVSRKIQTEAGPGNIVFDGTFIWVVNEDDSSVTKVNTGTGVGQPINITKGIYFTDYSSGTTDVYCAYVNGGSLVVTGTLTECN